MLPIAPKALRFTASSRASDRLAALVMLVVALTASFAGTGVSGSSNASASTESTAALRESEASECAGRATGTVSDSYKLAVCTDLDSDLVSIGALLALPGLAPTFTAVTSPVEVDFSGSPDPNSASAYMETQFFSAGLASVEPCKVIDNPGTAGSGPVPSLGHEAYCIVSPGGVASGPT